MGHPPESQKSEAALSHQIGNGAPGRDIGVSKPGQSHPRVI